MLYVRVCVFGHVLSAGSLASRLQIVKHLFRVPALGITNAVARCVCACLRVCGRVRCGKLHAVVCVLCSMLQVAALLRCTHSS